MKKIICVLMLCALALTFVACQKEPTQPEENGKVYVEFEGTKIVMGAKADDILASLGTANETKNVGDCGGLGAQIKYSYDSFDLYVLESNDKGNIIDGITFRDDMIETPEGVCIGQSVDKAKSALEKTFGAPESDADNATVYKNGAYAVVIGFADGKITEIDYITK